MTAYGADRRIARADTGGKAHPHYTNVGSGARWPVIQHGGRDRENASMSTLVGRIGATIVAILLYGWINFLAYPASSLLTGQTAGQQFEDSNVSYFSSMIGVRIFGHLGIPFVLLLIVVVLIWLGPLRRFLAGAAMFSALG